MVRAYACACALLARVGCEVLLTKESSGMYASQQGSRTPTMLRVWVAEWLSVRVFAAAAAGVRIPKGNHDTRHGDEGRRGSAVVFGTRNGERQRRTNERTKRTKGEAKRGRPGKTKKRSRNFFRHGAPFFHEQNFGPSTSAPTLHEPYPYWSHDRHASIHTQQRTTATRKRPGAWQSIVESLRILPYNYVPPFLPPLQQQDESTVYGFLSRSGCRKELSRDLTAGVVHGKHKEGGHPRADTRARNSGGTRPSAVAAASLG
jgi:hypothetical protein